MITYWLLSLSTIILKIDVTENELQTVLSRLQQSASLTDRRMELVVDENLSRGFAAVSWDGSNATIYVHPVAMKRESLNNWAFVMGHEIGHQILNHTGKTGADEEFAADVWGGQLAIKAGYDPKPYIIGMLARPNSCSISHGCWHNRAENLEKGLGVNVEGFEGNSGYMAYEGCDCKSEEEHKKHLAAIGPFVPVVTIFSKDPLKSYDMLYSTGCIISSGQH